MNEAALRPRRHELVIDHAEPRIDRALAAALPLSRSRVQALIADGHVTVDGAIVDRPSSGVAAGARVVVFEPVRPTSRLEPEALPLAVLHEDEACLVIDKPAGMVVHPAPGHARGTVINALLHHRPEVSGVGGERKAGLVHRLDKDTTGCLLVAKSDAAHRALSAQFAERSVEKRYLALSWGHLKGEEGAFDAPIGRAPEDRQKMSSRARRARQATTRWRVLERYAVADLVELDLVTGRTHQIRVHLSESGHPVIGDARYGGGPARARGFHGPQLAIARRAAALAGRQMLHAARLTFTRVSDGKPVTVESPLSEDFETLLAWLREHPFA